MKVVGLGAGGHAKVLIEVLRAMGGFELTGLLDINPDLWNTQVLGVPVLGSDVLLPELKTQGVHHAFIGLASIESTQPRADLYRKAADAGFRMVQAVHPSAVISPSAETGAGLSVMATAVINAAVVLGDNVIVNTGGIVEHDCVIGDHVHVATGARLAATVCVGDGAHIGAGATVRQSITIGPGAVVGAGAVVVSDVPSDARVAGVPARPMADNNSSDDWSTSGAS